MDEPRRIILRRVPVPADKAGSSTELISHGNTGPGALETNIPFPACVEGRNAEGHRFREDTVLERLTGQNVCLLLERPVEAGTRLLVTVAMYVDDESRDTLHPRIELRTAVLEAAQVMDGKWRVQMEIKNYRFLYAT